jgi:hypothetical protein
MGSEASYSQQFKEPVTGRCVTKLWEAIALQREQYFLEFLEGKVPIRHYLSNSHGNL